MTTRKAIALVLVIFLAGFGASRVLSQSGFVNQMGLRVDGASRPQVVGPDAVGGPPTGAPILHAVYDGANVQYLKSGAAGVTSLANGVLTAQVAVDPCGSASVTKSSAIINFASATTTELAALTGGQNVFACAFNVDILGLATTAGTFKFVSGTGTNCGTGQANLTGAWFGSTGRLPAPRIRAWLYRRRLPWVRCGRLSNLLKARSSPRYHPPRPWRGRQETNAIKRIVWLWYSHSGPGATKESGRAVARHLEVSHTYVQKLSRKYGGFVRIGENENGFCLWESQAATIPRLLATRRFDSHPVAAAD